MRICRITRIIWLTIIVRGGLARVVGTRAGIVNVHVLYDNPRHSRLSWGAVIVEVDTVLQSVTTFPPINSDIGEIARATIGQKTGVRSTCTTTINNRRCSSAICTKGNGRRSRTIQRRGSQTTSSPCISPFEEHPIAGLQVNEIGLHFADGLPRRTLTCSTIGIVSTRPRNIVTGTGARLRKACFCREYY